MPTNLTPASDVWDGDPIVPDEGEEITAVTTGPGKGPLRRALQRLLDKIWSVVNGKVSLRALVVGPTGGSAVNPTAGQALIESLTVCPNYLGDQSSMQNYVEVSSLLAPIGAARLRGGRLAFTGVTTGTDGGNYQGTDPITNELRPSLITKAWAVARTNDGAFPGRFVKRVNMFGCTIVGGGASPSEVQFVMASPMDSAEYVVLPTIMVYATRVQVPWTKITRTSATTFKIEAAVDFAATNYEVDVIVHGIQQP